jgi:hypothetical protein
MVLDLHQMSLEIDSLVHVTRARDGLLFQCDRLYNLLSYQTITVAFESNHQYEDSPYHQSHEINLLQILQDGQRAEFRDYLSRSVKISIDICPPTINDKPSWRALTSTQSYRPVLLPMAHPVPIPKSTPLSQGCQRVLKNKPVLRKQGGRLEVEPAPDASINTTSVHLLPSIGVS